MAWGWLFKKEPKHVATIDNILNKSYVRRQFSVLFIEVTLWYTVWIPLPSVRNLSSVDEKKDLVSNV
jgi:hypothetical protein